MSARPLSFERSGRIAANPEVTLQKGARSAYGNGATGR